MFLLIIKVVLSEFQVLAFPQIVYTALSEKALLIGSITQLLKIDVICSYSGLNSKGSWMVFNLLLSLSAIRECSIADISFNVA